MKLEHVLKFPKRQLHGKENKYHESSVMTVGPWT